MICSILTAIEIIDDAKALFDKSAKTQPVILIGGQITKEASAREPGTMEMVNYSISTPSPNYLHNLYQTKVVALRERTDCPHDLVEAIDTLLAAMIKNRSAIRWQRLSE